MMNVRGKGLLVSIALALVLAIGIMGCGDGDKYTVLGEKVEDAFQLDFDSPGYNRIVPHNVSQKFVTWTPIAEQIAASLDQGDIEAALDLFYQDILATDPGKQDQFFFSVFISDWSVLFADPATVFEKYRDNDRNDLSDDERATCDLMVALAYELGNYDGAIHLELKDDYLYHNAYDDLYGQTYGELGHQLGALALEAYEKIARRYPNSKVSILANLAIAQKEVPDEDSRTRLEKIYKSIEERYPDSTYETFAQLMLCRHLEIMMRHGTQDYSGELINAYEKVLALPDIYFSTIDEQYASAHTSIRNDILEIDKL